MIIKKKTNLTNSNLQSMSINNWFFPPNYIISVRYVIMNCARCAWAYVTTAEIYCGHIQRCSFWFSECSFWLAVRLMHPSCIAVGCNQQLICRVMTPPAQHHTGTEHTQHLQGDSKGKGEKKKNQLFLFPCWQWCLCQCFEPFNTAELLWHT